MATIGATLKLFDQFSNTLNHAQQAMNSTIVVASRLKQMLQGTITLDVKIDIDQNHAISEAHAVRSRIMREIGLINAKLRIELPASLTMMFTNLQRLVMRLLVLVKQLGNHGGGGSGSGTAQLQAALQRIAALEQRILELQTQLNQRIRSGGTAAKGMSSSLGNIAAAYIAIAAAKKAMDVSDDYINTKARLNIVNDGKQTTAQLQDAIFASANRARGDYVTMASSVAKLGLLAGDAFNGNGEVVKFAELMQKSFKVSGASTQESQAGMYQLTQAMASGKLQGDEFRSIMENAPMLADAIAKYTGKTKGQLKDMSAQGTITANIIKGALFSAADDINKKFATMPATFGDNLTQMKNRAMQAFGPLIERINTLLNSKDGGAMLNDIFNAIAVSANVASNALSFLIEHWGVIKNVLIGIGVVLAYLAVMWIIQWVAAIWPILLVIAGIAILLTVLNKFGISSGKVIGAVIGAFAVLGAFIWNTVVGVLNAIIQYLYSVFVEPWIAVIEWVLNVFNGGFDSFGDAVKNLLGQIISWFLSLGKVVTKIIDSIFGTDWTSGLNSLQDNVLKWGKNDKAITLSREAPTINSRIEYGKAWDAGFNLGGGLMDKVANMTEGFKLDDNTTIGKVNEIGKIGDTVDISNEDLKAMRELAEMKSIQNFVTLTPTVQVTGDNHYHATGDVEDMAGALAVALVTHMDSSMDGVSKDGI
ncbi:tape measure protein [Paenibacillus ferrarius]|uniref:tape measure protein n=1 Tax=Paenibacillus ferrarius TaxID=1469647 RepID=UPI003D2CE31D